MRDGRRSRRSTPAAAALALAVALTVLGGLAGRPDGALGADPTAASASAAATATAAAEGGDVRSSGEGAGLAGAPLLAVGAVAAIGVASALATLAYVRLTRRPGGPAA